MHKISTQLNYEDQGFHYFFFCPFSLSLCLFLINLSSLCFTFLIV